VSARTPDQRLDCPDCGGEILCFDATLEILHEAPVCEGFQAKLDAVGGPPPETAVVAGVTAADGTFVEARRGGDSGGPL